MDKTRKQPELCVSYNEKRNRYDIDVELPGVKRSNIDLRVLSNGFMLSAPSSDNVEFREEHTFNWLVEEQKTTADFHSGRLTIHAPVREPHAEARNVNVK